MTPHLQSTYLKTLFEPDKLKAVINGLQSLILKSGVPFDFIAFRGNSGAAVAFPLSMVMGKQVLCVRKPEHNAHFGMRVEGWIGPMNYIIVDDLVSSGSTIKAIKEAVDEAYKGFHIPETPRCRGIFLYADAQSRRSPLPDVSVWVLTKEQGGAF